MGRMEVPEEADCCQKKLMRVDFLLKMSLIIATHPGAMDPPLRAWRDLLQLPGGRQFLEPICGTGLCRGIPSARPLEQAVY